jgi:ABC-type transport system involved in cytochrome c biogenesis permease subunit
MTTDRPEKIDRQEGSEADRFAPEPLPRRRVLFKTVEPVLRIVGSPVVSTVLFALAIFNVFAGTLAMARAGLWEVVDTYFRSAFVMIEFEAFFPPSFFPTIDDGAIPGAFPFPGGWLIGSLLAINMLAGMILRFKVVAKGRQLVTGLALVVVGCLLVAWVINSGSNESGVHSAELSWDAIWYLFLALLGVTSFACAGLASRVAMTPKTDENRQAQRAAFWFFVASSVVAAVLCVWLTCLQVLYEGEFRLNDDSMRILWQLAKATFAASVLCVGCWGIYGNRGGLVVLHVGVLVLMFGEILVGLGAVENFMLVKEGETVDFVFRPDDYELAFVDRSDEEFDNVVVVPQSMIIRNVKQKGGAPIKHDDLPVDIEVVKYQKNSKLRDVLENDDNPATAGAGGDKTRRRLRFSEERKLVPATEKGANVPATYVRFIDKATDESLGVYLAHPHLPAQSIEVGGKKYDFSFRNKRTYTEYSVYLYDVRGDTYIGSNTARKFTSDIRVIDESRNENRDIHIKMNRPLRFAGETFYQSKYINYERGDLTGIETTGLQVVTNTGWMIPYVACMIVTVGMVVQFWVVLQRFQQRRAREQTAEAKSLAQAKKKANDESTDRLGYLKYLAPVIAVVVCLGLLAYLSVPGTPDPEEFDLRAFGKLPVVADGRVKPLDTLARNSLVAISDRQVYQEEVDNGGNKANRQRLPAIKWLLEIITDAKATEDYPVFRIQNHDVLDVLNLQPRKGYRYAWSEFEGRLGEFEAQLRQVRDVPKEKRNAYQRKVSKLYSRLVTYRWLCDAFDELELPPRPTAGEFRDDPEGAARREREIIGKLRFAEANRDKMLASLPPRVVPMRPKGERFDDGEEEWLPYAVAWPRAYLEREVGLTEDATADAAIALKAIFDAYKADDAQRFNQAVSTYRRQLDEAKPAPVQYDADKLEVESSVNYAQPFFATAIIYLVVFLVVCFSWLISHKAIGNTAIALLLLALTYHTVALVLRMYISGRPPVTNLYSSAIFIGWGVIILGLVFELFYRNSMGVAVASIVGFVSLVIAHFLSREGDTIKVMNAVLDTGFWLATHVIIITLGYCATFMAGVFGIIYIFRGMFTPTLSPDAEKDLTRMTYGTLCFAMFFSFFGTVLGGLWGDDSWGRFWGWDPKENGALLIVLWVAMVLHCWLGRLVRERGLAVLAVAGNIATAWSWFGTNQLRVGLHSYGFTESAAKWLGIFVLTQLAIIGVGCLPKSLWWSFRDDNTQPSTAKT